MEDKITCPFCEAKIPPNSEECPNCGQQMPWMSHVYKRETNMFRGIKNASVDVVDSIYEKRLPDRGKLIGLINSLMIGRLVIIIGSILGAILVIVEVWTLIQQSQIMKEQNLLMDRQLKIQEKQDASFEFDQYLKIRNLLADTTYNKRYKSPRGTVITSSKYAIDFIKRLCEEQPLIYGPILQFLLSDSNQTVKSGALVCLLKIKNFKAELGYISLNNVDFGSNKLIFHDNYNYGFVNFHDCEFNTIEFRGSKVGTLIFSGNDIRSLKFSNAKVGRLDFNWNNLSTFSLEYSMILKMIGIGKFNNKRENPGLNDFILENTFIGSTSSHVGFLKKALSSTISSDKLITNYFTELLYFNMDYSERKRIEITKKNIQQEYLEHVNLKRDEYGLDHFQMEELDSLLNSSSPINPYE